jgi:hypothetical protein
MTAAITVSTPPPESRRQQNVARTPNRQTKTEHYTNISFTPNNVKNVNDAGQQQVPNSKLQYSPQFDASKGRHSSPAKAPPRTPQHSTDKKKRRTRKPKDLVKAPAPDSTLSDSAASEHTSPVATPTHFPDSPSKAYAGSGFHQSPAPSALPIPKFFSKSVPSNIASARLFQDDSDSVSVSPPSDTPLDMLFKAHAAEIARKRSNDSSDSDSATDRDIFGTATPRRPLATPHQDAQVCPTPSRAVTDTFIMEDLFKSLPSSPAPNSTPYSIPSQHKGDLYQYLARSTQPSSAPSSTPQYRGRTAVNNYGSPLRAPPPRQMYHTPEPPKSPEYYTPLTSPLRSPEPQYNCPPQFPNMFEVRSDNIPCGMDDNTMQKENKLREMLNMAPRVIHGVMY